MIAVFFVKYLLMCLCVCLPHCPPGRLCVHWSRTMQPENRGWPSSWSRWWPSWVWRAEDRTSQGALGRDPIRNRAVPERRPVPIFFIMWLLPPPFKVDFFLDLFSASSSPRDILFSSSTLLHRLVYLNISEGLFGAEADVSHSAMREIAQLHHRESLKGGLLESWPYWQTSVPLLEEKRGKTFLCCLQEFTLIIL